MILRPTVRRDPPDDGVELRVTEDDASSKGAKRKRAPPTKGPCEHGRVRSKCKECGGGSICEHGRERHRCKECGGGSICEHGRIRSRCKDCGGPRISTPS